jgi:hypothetical protein
LEEYTAFIFKAEVRVLGIGCLCRVRRRPARRILQQELGDWERLRRWSGLIGNVPIPRTIEEGRVRCENEEKLALTVVLYFCFLSF